MAGRAVRADANAPGVVRAPMFPSFAWVEAETARQRPYAGRERGKGMGRPQVAARRPGRLRELKRTVGAEKLVYCAAGVAVAA